MHVPKVVLAGLVLLGAALAGPAPLLAPAAASPIVQTSVVSARPASSPPRITTGTAAYKLLQAGPTMYVGGDFTGITNAARTQTFARHNLFSFEASTGAVTRLSATFDGPVWALAHHGDSLYVGGTFRTVNGSSRRALVKVDAATGAVDRAFDARLLTGSVTEAQVVRGRLVVGGTFGKRLAALDLTTGADTGYLDLGITGTVATNAGPTGVYRFAVDRDSTRLVAIGNMTHVAGRERSRAFMVDLGTSAGTLASWYYPPLKRACAASKLQDYLRDVDFSPDGRWFVMVSTGYVPLPGDLGLTVCDATARFETGIVNPTRPTWINYTGGDTLHSVVATNAAVYVQGHQRWLDNAAGRDSCAPGCAARPGIGAISPSTGRALSWNPTKSRGVGGKDLLLTPQGLWVASDTTQLAGQLHERLGLFPLP